MAPVLNVNDDVDDDDEFILLAPLAAGFPVLPRVRHTAPEEASLPLPVSAYIEYIGPPTPQATLSSRTERTPAPLFVQPLLATAPSEDLEMNWKKKS